MKNIIKLTIIFLLLSPSSSFENQGEIYSIDYDQNNDRNELMTDLSSEITTQPSFPKENIYYDLADYFSNSHPKNEIINNENGANTQLLFLNDDNTFESSDLVKKSTTPSKYIGLGKRFPSKSRKVKRQSMSSGISESIDNNSFVKNNFRLIGLGKRSLNNKYLKNYNDVTFIELRKPKRNEKVRFIGLGKRSPKNFENNPADLKIIKRSLKDDFTDIKNEKVKRRNPYVFRVIPFIYRRQSNGYYPMLPIGRKRLNNNLKMESYENKRIKRNILSNNVNENIIKNYQDIDQGKFYPTI